jgi:hypothetical protein
MAPRAIWPAAALVPSSPSKATWAARLAVAGEAWPGRLADAPRSTAIVVAPTSTATTAMSTTTGHRRRRPGPAGEPTRTAASTNGAVTRTGWVAVPGGSGSAGLVWPGGPRKAGPVWPGGSGGASLVWGIGSVSGAATGPALGAGPARAGTGEPTGGSEPRGLPAPKGEGPGGVSPRFGPALRADEGPGTAHRRPPRRPADGGGMVGSSSTTSASSSGGRSFAPAGKGPFPGCPSTGSLSNGKGPAGDAELSLGPCGWCRGPPDSAPFANNNLSFGPKDYPVSQK